LGQKLFEMLARQINAAYRRGANARGWRKVVLKGKVMTLSAWVICSPGGLKV
jgi:hypothetical protein